MNGEDKEQQLKEAICGRRSDHRFPLASGSRLSSASARPAISCRSRCGFPARWSSWRPRATGARRKIDFLGQIQDETQATVANVRDFIKISLDQENKERAAKGIYQYDAGFTLEPGRYQMKFLVRENVTGKIGHVMRRASSFRI